MGTATPKHTNPVVIIQRVGAWMAARRLIASSTGEYPLVTAPAVAHAVTNPTGPPRRPPPAPPRHPPPSPATADPSRVEGLARGAGRCLSARRRGRRGH